MASRIAAGTADLSEIGRRIASGALVVHRGCYLEVSSAVWHPAADDARADFLGACDLRGVEYRFVQQIGGVDVVCD